MAKRCTQCGSEMVFDATDISETVRGVKVRMLRVPAWVCPNGDTQQVSLPVAKYISEYLRRILSDPPATPADMDQPLIATEVVFAAR